MQTLREGLEFQSSKEAGVIHNLRFDPTLDPIKVFQSSKEAGVIHNSLFLIAMNRY